MLILSVRSTSRQTAQIHPKHRAKQRSTQQAPTTHQTKKARILRAFVQNLSLFLRNLTTPKGTRTPVLAVRGLCPRPLDDGGKLLPVLTLQPCLFSRLYPLCGFLHQVEVARSNVILPLSLWQARS